MSSVAAAASLVIALVLAACAAPAEPAAAADAPAPVDLPARRDAVTVAVPGDGVRLGGYLFRPEGAPARAPAVIVLHGSGGSAATYAYISRRVAKRGFVTLGLSMRGSRGSGGKGDCGLRQPDDIVRAAEWLARQPGVDPGRIGILGFSMGGQVALLAGARTRRLRAIVAYKAVTDIAQWKRTTDRRRIPRYIAHVCEPGGADRRSPTAQAARISAPVLLIHGLADTQVPTAQAELMRDALVRAGKPVELRLVPGLRHKVPLDRFLETLPWITEFFGRHLRR